MTAKFGGANLDERIRAREWMYWGFDRLAAPIYRSRGLKLGFRQGGPDVVEMYLNEGKGSLQVLDGHLAGRSWIVGEGPTIADIDLYGVVAYAAEGGFDLADFANVAAWAKRVEALPGFQPAGFLPRETKAAA